MYAPAMLKNPGIPIMETDCISKQCGGEEALSYKSNSLLHRRSTLVKVIIIVALQSRAQTTILTDYVFYHAAQFYIHWQSYHKKPYFACRAQNIL